MFRNPRIPMAADPRTSSPLNPSATDGIVCPFCAHVRGRDAGGACPKCTMEDTIITRRSTGERIGPWFVLQRKNPTAPGLRFSVLLTLARRGHVTGKSIVRGPTTGQLWRYAAEVKGLSRLFGVCWHCHSGISPDATTCPRCKSAQEIPDDPDVFLESHSSLPLMREFTPSGAAELPAFSDQPVVSPNEERLPARSLREPPVQAALPRRIDRPANLPRQTERAPAGFDTVEDLSRALTLQQNGNEGDSRRPQRGRSTGEVILSASELAAAFSLNAPAPSLATRTRRGIWTLIKVVVVLLIVLGIAGAIVGYLKPEWRMIAQERATPYVTQAHSWWDATYAKIRGDAAVGTSPATAVLPTTSQAKTPLDDLPPPTPIHLDGNNTQTVVSSKVMPPQGPSVVDQSPAVVDGLGGQTSHATPTTKPGTAPKQPTPDPVTVATRESTPTVVKVEPPVVKPTPKPEATKPEPTKAEQKPDPKPAGHEMTLDEAIAQATELRNSALDAEARRDWRAAILIYEQIETLPEAARPSDLKVRMELARQRLQGQ